MEGSNSRGLEKYERVKRKSGFSHKQIKHTTLQLCEGVCMCVKHTTLQLCEGVCMCVKHTTLQLCEGVCMCVKHTTLQL